MALLLLLSRNIVVFVPMNSEDGAGDALGIADGMKDGDSEGIADKEGAVLGCVDGAALTLGRNEG